MKRIMMIGFGAMAQVVWQNLPEGLELAWVVVPENSVAKVQEQLPEQVQVMSSIAACKHVPDLVIEVAGQAAVKEHAEAVLSKGWDLAMISVGALADEDLSQRLQQVAKQHDSHLIALSGAVAGMDGLAAARELGLHTVTYQGRKNPKSWQGSHAEHLVDLQGLQAAQVFFQGSAREAAMLFPANANVAATVALAGLGMDGTQVELIADPAVSRNQHTIIAKGEFGEMRIELMGIPLPSNPKTSTLAALSVLRQCRQLVQSIQI